MSSRSFSPLSKSQRRTLLRTAFALLCIFLAAGVGLAGWQIWSRISGREIKPVVQVGSDATGEPRWRSALNGVAVSGPEFEQEPVVAVMIDNHAAARPQAGVARASLVYEVPVEGGFTRYIAVYPLTAPTSSLIIGPVRSARPYAVEIGTELSAMYAHVGGSNEALEVVGKIGTWDFNEYSRGQYFHRSDDRDAPHNVLTDTAQLRAGYDRYFGARTVARGSWKWNDAPIATGTIANTVVIDWAERGNEVTWEYSSVSSTYRRMRGTIAHVDADGTPVEANTIIVQRVTSKVLDAEGRLRVDLVGTGTGDLFRDGRRIPLTWSKKSSTERTQWLDATTGEPVALRSGVVWIEVVPKTVGVSVR